MEPLRFNWLIAAIGLFMQDCTLAGHLVTKFLFFHDRLFNWNRSNADCQQNHKIHFSFSLPSQYAHSCLPWSVLKKPR